MDSLQDKAEPQRRLRVAVVGCGRIARHHASAYAKVADRFEIVAFVDRDLDRARLFAEEHGGAAVASVREAREQTELDAVDLCLPPAEHCPEAVGAADLGLHVLCEKPLALTCDEVDRMVEAGGRNHVVVMSGQSRRFNGPLRKVKELMDSAAIGTPLLGFMVSGGRTENLATPWWGDPAVAGPSLLLYNWGAHFLDWAYYLYGPPHRLYAEGGDTGGPTAGVDNLSLLLGYEAPLVVTVTWSHAGRVPGCSGCAGTQGTVEFGGETGVLLNGEPVPNEDRAINQFDTMFREFHAAVTQGREPETSAARCRVVIEMIEAALRSCASHEPVAITGQGAVRYPVEPVTRAV